MTKTNNFKFTRRSVLASSAAFGVATLLPKLSIAQQNRLEGVLTMSTFTTTDNINIFYKDWGPKDAQPIVFHHGWPLSADDWDNQMLYFLSRDTV